MKEIKLFNSLKVFKVDDEDFEKLIKLNWSLRTLHGDQIYSTTDQIPIGSFILNNYEDIIDHRDRNVYNNQKENLRPCTQSQNRQNSSIRSDNTSGYKGVTWVKRDLIWKAQIFCNHRNIFLGNFKDKNKAAIAYNKAAINYFGEFAVLNIIKE